MMLPEGCSTISLIQRSACIFGNQSDIAKRLQAFSGLPNENVNPKDSSSEADKFHVSIIRNRFVKKTANSVMPLNNIMQPYLEYFVVFVDLAYFADWPPQSKKAD